jgi:hypothetical protein
MTVLDAWKDAFNSVGWFIPPYIQMGVLAKMAARITEKRGSFSQTDLENMVSNIYDPLLTACMVANRYTLVPFIVDYAVTIAESVEAHFLGLDHVAVSGLMPVIEGAGRDLAAQRGMASGGIKEIFKFLATDVKRESAEKNLGAVDEIASMMDSFMEFTNNYFYERSNLYPLSDRTNRHGILHGKYKDTDYGTPLNFYKTIASVDFLTFTSCFRANISWFAPDVTPEAIRLAQYYEYLKALHANRETI